MALLLYKSNEMFSSTDLIRKSKMIFDKIVDREIEKAIILRDGKPGFLLMDFQKYESIMADYENLKQKYEKLSNNKKIKIKEEALKKVENKQDDQKDKLEKLLDSLPDNAEPQKNIEQLKPIEEINLKEEKTKDAPALEEPLSEQDEISQALFKIKDIVMSKEEKEKVTAQIKERIKKARLERERVLKQTDPEKEDLKEELQLQVQLKEKNKKKEQELKEFWD